MTTTKTSRPVAKNLENVVATWKSGTITAASLQKQQGVSARTAQRKLNALVRQGILERVGVGSYAKRSAAISGSRSAQRILSVIRSLDAEAHLTGFDVLASYAHQFSYEWPHLVYCQPSHVGELTRALEDRGFLVSPAGARALVGPKPDLSVIVRSQPSANTRYPVRDNVATPEKAWVDLLRETRKTKLPFDYGELGRILRSLEAAGRDMRTLKAYARRAGYLHTVNAAMGEIEQEESYEKLLNGGYAA